MKVIAFLKAKDGGSDALMIQIDKEEFERIMGLEAKEHKTNLSRMQGKTLKLPDVFGQLTWLKNNKKTLKAVRNKMLDMAEMFKDLLPEDE